MLVLAVVFAVLGAASNAAGTAFQRKAAATVTRGGGLRLLRALARRPAWIAGIAGVIGAALFQALALTFGPLALVQPLFILELPFALLIAAPLLHRRLPAVGWYGVATVVLGLALLLGSAAPTGSTSQAPMDRWIPALAVCLGLIGAAVLAAARSDSSLFRATSLGTAAAIGNALTAALLKSATGTFSDHGLTAFLTTWQTYGFALTGIAAVLLLENALQAGSLAASQPALTIGDATVSLLLGVTLLGETIRTGWFVIPELAGVAMIVAGVLTLTRAVPHIRATAD
ncbi:DMT family transporter [Streptacidiphilus neutrinimicus]|uniref:DMT family transporter n=1 Tax=Streptacidiphilus neutrinimicus TaxID=105420 RepID=UPI0005A65E5F|nr:DMT family transporter [Streptacidiphilus neutrinimicus]